MWPGLPLAFALSLGVASVGASLTDIGPWYLALRQPDWKPPDIAFGPIWTTIFTLCAVSGWLAWYAAINRAERRALLWVFACNAVFNVLWSYLYFGLQRPDWALLEWVALWLSVLAVVLVLRRIAPAAGWMNLPYLLWVSAAGLLNLATVELNGPFG
ncbi:MAG: tryptophan-rich sensory protein [Betaproteobacteria bacterium]|nr:tryptophan-rich sensory protein [Betaproteobacteria bacterium]